MKLAWISDIHLDSLEFYQLMSFVNELANSESDAILISGDISNGRDLLSHLKIFSESIKKPIFFTLGNHDFWQSGFRKSNADLKLFCQNYPNLRYLNHLDYIPLSSKTALVGHNGWYSASSGDPYGSNYFMVDWKLIDEFKSHLNYPLFVFREHIVDLSQMQARESAYEIKCKINHALENGFQKIIICSHMPPFNEVHYHEGQQSHNVNAMPWYVNLFLGEVLAGFAEDYPNIKFEVYSGHSHGRIEKQIFPNLLVKVAGAEYCFPEIQEIINSE